MVVPKQGLHWSPEVKAATEWQQGPVEVQGLSATPEWTSRGLMWSPPNGTQRVSKGSLGGSWYTIWVGRSWKSRANIGCMCSSTITAAYVRMSVLDLVFGRCWSQQNVYLEHATLRPQWLIHTFLKTRTQLFSTRVPNQETRTNPKKQCH